jgi:three-Cys-motif partner protein
MAKKQFFDERTESSRVKAEIAWKYFSAWSKVMTGHSKKSQFGSDHRLAYVDLFAGPGMYEDGSKSTPILILNEILSSSSLIDNVISVFNDMNSDHIDALEGHAESLPGIEKMKFAPKFLSHEVGDGNIAKTLSETYGLPTFYFLDPFGYKDVRISLLTEIIQGFGCDVLMFFNYNRFNLDVSKASAAIQRHLQGFLGDISLEQLRRQITNKDPADREAIVIEFVRAALVASGAKYVVRFAFNDETAARTSHYLFLLTKNPKGEEIMKGILHGYSSKQSQGVASFKFNPVREEPSFDFEAPIEDLGVLLCNTFAQQSITVGDIIATHSPGTVYVRKNYKDALKFLESNGKISITPTRQELVPDTMPDRVMVKFLKST